LFEEPRNADDLRRVATEQARRGVAVDERVGATANGGADDFVERNRFRRVGKVGGVGVCVFFAALEFGELQNVANERLQAERLPFEDFATFPEANGRAPSVAVVEELNRA
jgi:hypothetical protein